MSKTDAEFTAAYQRPVDADQGANRPAVAEAYGRFPFGHEFTVSARSIIGEAALDATFTANVIADLVNLLSNRRYVAAYVAAAADRSRLSTSLSAFLTAVAPHISIS